MNRPSNTDVADALRRLADFVEAAEVPSVTYTDLTLWSVDDRDVLADLARAAVRHGCTVHKEYSEQLFKLTIGIGALRVTVLSWREDVCERVVVATREITELVPDPDATVPPLVERTRTEEVVEWRCAPLLSGTTS